MTTPSFGRGRAKATPSPSPPSFHGAAPARHQCAASVSDGTSVQLSKSMLASSSNAARVLLDVYLVKTKETVLLAVQTREDRRREGFGYCRSRPADAVPLPAALTRQ